MHDRNWITARRSALWTALALMAGFGLLGTSAGARNAKPNPEVRVRTNMGSFVIELWPKLAPLTVKDFLHYVHSGFYTHTLFHRVIAHFIVQGGGYRAAPPYARKPTGPPVGNESGNGLLNQTGTVGLARGVDPDSGTSQFFVNLADNRELNPEPGRWGYTVFGKVIQGMRVVERIGAVPTGAFGPFEADAPLTPVIIKSIRVIPPLKPHPAPAGASAAGSARAAAHPHAAPAQTIVHMSLYFPGASYALVSDASGRSLYRGFVWPGTSLSFKGRAPLHLVLSNASDVQVTVNGRFASLDSYMKSNHAASVNIGPTGHVTPVSPHPGG